MTKLLPDKARGLWGLTSAWQRSQQKWLLRRQEKREKSLQAAGQKEASCQNCGETMKGPFCYACGQKDHELRRPWWSLFNDVMDEFLSTDSRIIRTILVLVVMPGMLTRDYLDGHRARYVTPMKLYLITTLVFFVLLEISNVALVQIQLERKPASGNHAIAEQVRSDVQGLTISNIDELPDDERLKVQDALAATGLDTKSVKQRIQAAGEATVEKPTQDQDWDLKIVMFMPLIENATNIEMANEIQSSEDIGLITTGEDQALGVAFKDAARAILAEPTLLNDTFNTWLPRAMLVLVPIFALMLRTMHWGQRRYYINQMIFSLHFHTFVFILMMPMMIIVPRLGNEFAGQFFTVSVVVWLLVALKVAQRQGWIRTIFKFLWLWINYLVVVFVTMAAVLIIGLVDF